MSDEKSLARGLAADSLLNNELFREVMNGLDQYYHAAWRVAKTVEAREDCHRYVTLVEKFLADITTISTTGKFAEKRLKELEGKRVISWPIR